MKPLSETKFGQIVAKILPTAATDLENLVPGGHTIKAIVDTITGSQNISSTDKIQAIAAANELMSEFELELKDRSDARAMQNTALGQDDKFSKRFVYFLAMAIVALTFAFDFTMFFVKYPSENRDVINMVAGVLNTTCLATIIGFYYGSSKSSGQKDEMMKQIIAQQNSN